nr:PREDICTED: epithelial chloride channel protein-like [Lepisosteus oculatus]
MLSSVLLLCWTVSVTLGSPVQLINNGYRGVVVAINPRVPENPALIEKIKEMFTEASPYLFTAARKRAFFKDVRILIPTTWKENHSLYKKPSTETYKEASVQVADPFCDKSIGAPYTSTLGYCGKEGKHIHLTPEYLLNDQAIDMYGPRGRVLVYTWAILRWGVFSEFNFQQPFHRHFTGEIEAVRCSKNIRGSIKNRYSKRDCKIDPWTGLPSKNCVFIPHKEQNTKASIMYQPSIPQVTEFCDDSTHNFEVLNDQNKQCDYRSVWGVISQTKDFKGGNNPPMTADPPSPTFTLLRARQRVVCLVLDTSGSMKDSDRINRLRQAAMIFLDQIVEQGSRVGIVEFKNDARILKGLVLIDGQAARTQLASALPSAADGGTKICSGIQKAFEVLRQDDGDTAGDEIILLTDGEDSSVGSCLEEVKRSGVTVHTIALGPSADPRLEEFATGTGGKSFSANDKLDSNALMDAFSDITSQSGDDITSAVQLLSKGGRTIPGSWFQGEVPVDSTVGKNTVLAFTWEHAQPDITVRSPSGGSYKNNDMEIHSGEKIAKLNIPGIAEIGIWSYKVVNTHSSPQTFTLLVTSRAADECVPPVIVSGGISETQTTYPQPLLISAQLSQGAWPVINANVTAIVDLGEKTVNKLRLVDSGTGADKTKDDGIYSAMFHSFKGNGRYSVKFEVQGVKGGVEYPKNAVPERPRHSSGRMRRSAPSLRQTSTALGSFSRTASGGTVTVKGVPAVPRDDFPPGKVTDLTASALRESFTAALPLNTSSLHSVPAGQTQTLLLPLEPLAAMNQSVVYLALRATDEEGGTSEISSITQLSTYEALSQAPAGSDPSRCWLYLWICWI